MIAMSLQIAGIHAEGYRVNTPVYEGPLDLLLHLIERAELDITTLALAQVTDQYLEYLHHLEDRNPDEVSAFLVIAARLVLIKSQALLPRPTLEGTLVEEDTGEALARQLIQYRRFKQLAGFLDERQVANLRTYLRLTSTPIKIEANLDMGELSLDDLVKAAREKLIGNFSIPLDQVVNIPRISIRDKISTILEVLRHSPVTSFLQLVKVRSRIEIVVTFLAMLELSKRNIIELTQSSLFGDIQLHAAGNIQENDIGDVEFNE
jgi:segregation and condensation protein A